MSTIRWIGILLLLYIACAMGCVEKQIKYGRETPLELPNERQQVWAIAPVDNLSGQPGVDPLLQADIIFHQLQTVKGVTVIPVDRVAQVYTSLAIEKVQTPEQASAVIDLLGCDGLLVATVTAYDPYNPPKFGVAVQLFQKPGGYTRPPLPDTQALIHAGAPLQVESLPKNPDFLQVVGMYDAQNGTVRDEVGQFALGRNDQLGPMGEKEYFSSMDRYCEFGYHAMLEQLLVRLGNGR